MLAKQIQDHDYVFLFKDGTSIGIDDESMAISILDSQHEQISEVYKLGDLSYKAD